MNKFVYSTDEYILTVFKTNDKKYSYEIKKSWNPNDIINKENLIFNEMGEALKIGLEALYDKINKDVLVKKDLMKSIWNDLQSIK